MVSAENKTNHASSDKAFGDLAWLPSSHQGNQPETTEFVPFHAEGLKEKLLRKTKENPFVPAGCLLTAAVLSYGLWSFRTGNMQKSQTMMRLRIGAQGFTIGALLLGIGINVRNQSKKPVH
ncbi:PREDICTED: HIG1 domain family member 2A, mitochondrial-like [Priapulus caudatus]|uniref:HIG1 domain family member 2A, mitochondrial-like n=1 Tax=Priapulus caudatus TaxID=37621 RepID=A0ABM1DP98_PRICU|nr:PREDICTED: HIG1 domain family member 2A, mitochondrial-like [Priapulus caudatus]